MSASETRRPDLAAPPVRPGDLVAHYEILAVVGQGGMGVVFRARDARLEREVALKCPWPRLAADPVARERFLREARSAARLSHPNVVPVFETFEWQGLPWVAMDLVEGAPLAAALAGRSPLPLARILLVAEGLAGALAAAHAKGILHRDLNPNNILLRPDGWPLLTDFGLAHLVEPDSGEDATTLSGPLSLPGQVLGTRAYMAPEQVLGRRLDARCDLFAFGAVLYEMCTGRRAFEASEPGDEFDAILHRDPPLIAPLNPEIPEELERIARRALAKRPQDRYPDARALLADLTALRRRVESADLGPAPATADRPRGVRAARWVLAALLAAAALVALVSTLRSRAPARGLLPGTPRQLTGDRGWESDPALSPDGSLIAFTADAGGSPDLWLADTRGGSRLRLTEDAASDRSPAWFPDGSALAFVSDRGGADAIWTVSRLGGVPTLLLPDAVDPALSPDGTRIAFARPDASGLLRIAVAPLADPAAARWLSSGRDSPWEHRQPAWSPDSRTLCFTDLRDLWRVDAGGGGARRLTTEGAVDLEPVFSSDGRFVLFSSYREGTLALWRVAAAGGAPERLTMGSGPESHPSVARDGARLAYTTYLHDYDVALVSRATGARAAIRTLLDEAAPALAPDARSLVYTGSGRGAQSRLWRQALAGGRPAGPARPLTDPGWATNTPACSPDGAWIAFKREREGRREIWIVPAAGGPAERFSDGTADEVNPAWSADGRELAFASPRTGSLKIWSAPVAAGRRAGPAVQLTTGEGTDHLPAWSWDGAWLAWVRGLRTSEEIWIRPARGGGAPRVLARGDQVGRLRWDRATGRLWFSVAAAGEAPRLASVAPAGGEPVLAADDLVAGAAAPGDFDLAADGSLLAYTREELRGDLWMLEAREGSY